MKRSTTILLSLFLLTAQLHAGSAVGDGVGHYTEERVYQSRPDPSSERYFGGIGTTGLKARIYPGVVLKVHYTVVPETSIATLLGGFGVLTLLRRRRAGNSVREERKARCGVTDPFSLTERARSVSEPPFSGEAANQHVQRQTLNHRNTDLLNFPELMGFLRGSPQGRRLEGWRPRTFSAPKPPVLKNPIPKPPCQHRI